MRLDADLKDGSLLPATVQKLKPLPSAIIESITFPRLNHVECLKQIRASYNFSLDADDPSDISSTPTSGNVPITYYDKAIHRTTNRSSVNIMGHLLLAVISPLFSFSIPDDLQGVWLAFAYFLISKRLSETSGSDNELHLRTLGLRHLQESMTKLEIDQQIDGKVEDTPNSNSTKSKLPTDIIIAELAQFALTYADYDLRGALTIAKTRINAYQNALDFRSFQTLQSFLTAPMLMFKSFWFAAYSPRILKEFEDMTRKVESIYANDVDYTNLISYFDVLNSVVAFRDRTMTSTDMMNLNNASDIYRLYHGFISILPQTVVNLKNEQQGLSFLYICLGTILDALFPRIISYFGHGFLGDLVYWYNECPVNLTTVTGTRSESLSTEDSNRLLSLVRYSYRVLSFLQARFNMLTVHSLLFRSSAMKDGIVVPSLACRDINEVMLKRFEGKGISAVNYIHIPEMKSRLLSEVTEHQIIGLEYDGLYQYNSHHYSLLRCPPRDAHDPNAVADGLITSSLPVSYLEEYLLRDFKLERDRLLREICNQHIKQLNKVLGEANANKWLESLRKCYQELLDNQQQLLLPIARLLAADMQPSKSWDGNSGPAPTCTSGLKVDDFDPATILGDIGKVHDCHTTADEVRSVVSQLLGIWLGTLHGVLQ